MNNKSNGSVWIFVITCIFCAVIAYCLFAIYGFIHWKIIARNYNDLPDGVKQDLCKLLSYLEWYRIFGVFSITSAFFAGLHKPRWLAIIYIPIAILCLLIVIGVM